MMNVYSVSWGFMMWGIYWVGVLKFLEDARRWRDGATDWVQDKGRA